MTEQSTALRLADAMRFVTVIGSLDAKRLEEAASELRRLHEENGRLRIVAEMSTLLLDQRSALLEALRPFAAINASIGFTYKDVGRARAAIKAVEENT